MSVYLTVRVLCSLPSPQRYFTSFGIFYFFFSLPVRKILRQGSLTMTYVCTRLKIDVGLYIIEDFKSDPNALLFCSRPGLLSRSIFPCPGTPFLSLYTLFFLWVFSLINRHRIIVPRLISLRKKKKIVEPKTCH